MMNIEEIQHWRKVSSETLEKAGIVLTEKEVSNIEVTDLALNDFKRTGLCLVIYENNDRYCAKELILLPRQTCPQHKHPSIRNIPGKMETFRCRKGEVYLYVEGDASPNPVAHPPVGDEQYYTVYHEIHLRPGEQYTIPENTFHWFQAGDEGAIVSEFSTTSRDESDVFEDPRIVRVPS